MYFIDVPEVIPDISTLCAAKILLLVPQYPSSVRVTALEKAEPFLLIYALTSVFIVAVPEPSSISITISPVVGADSAVVATDCKVKSP